MASFSSLFKKFGLTSVKLKAGILDAEWKPNDSDQAAAWHLYVELITRVATQHLAPGDGDEASALRSIHSLFGATRETLRSHGRHAENFTRLAVAVLNQVVRPFTAKWHRAEVAGELPSRSGEFREELAKLQESLRGYTALLAELAEVEDLTDMEPNS